VEPVVATEEPTVVPHDASSLTTDDSVTTDNSLTIEKTDSAAPLNEAPRTETPEETLRRLNDEGKKDS
jgi:preprotein translocase subunit YajC